MEIRLIEPVQIDEKSGFAVGSVLKVRWVVVVTSKGELVHVLPRECELVEKPVP